MSGPNSIASTWKAMPYPLLWHFPISHYNEKARWALDFKGIPHRRRALGPAYLFQAYWATGKGTLPILFLEGKAIGDSTRIIEALERFQPDPPLYPSDESERRRALELEDFFDEELGPHVRTALLGPLFSRDPEAAFRILTTGMKFGSGTRRVLGAVLPAFAAFYKYRHVIDDRTTGLAPAKVAAALDRLEREIQPSGYLVAGRFSVADLAAAALFAPLVLPREFPYPPAEPHPQVLVNYRDSLATRSGFRWVEEMYRRHRGRSAEVAK